MTEHACSCENCKYADHVSNICRKYSCSLATICATEDCWESCRTCDSCKYFTKGDWNESEGYCNIDKRWCDPCVGSDCMNYHAYNDKYCPYFGKYCDCEKEEYEVCDLKSVYGDQLELLHDEDFDTWLTLVLDRQSNQLDGFMKNVDITVNSLDAKYELLSDRVHHLKDLFEDLETQINDLSIQLDELRKFLGYHFSDPAIGNHTGCDFCGNCAHYVRPKTPATLPVCDLSGEIVDPDASSCAMFEHPF